MVDVDNGAFAVDNNRLMVGGWFTDGNPARPNKEHFIAVCFRRLNQLIMLKRSIYERNYDFIDKYSLTLAKKGSEFFNDRLPE